MEAPKQYDWHGLVGWVSAISGGLIAVIKAWKTIMPWIKRFVNLPKRIEELAMEGHARNDAQLVGLKEDIDLLGARVRMIQSRSEESFMEFDAAGRVIYASPRVLQLLGRGQDECRGNNWWHAIHADGGDSDDRQGPRTRWEAALKRAESYEETVIVRSAVANIDTRCRLEILPLMASNGGKVLGWKAIIRPETVAERRVAG